MSKRPAISRTFDPIDDGRHGPYKCHFACFNCRKVFKPHTAAWWGSSADMERCPDCGGEVWNMGVAFKAPKRGDIKAWRRLKKKAIRARGYEVGDPRRKGQALLREFEKRR